VSAAAQERPDGPRGDLAGPRQGRAPREDSGARPSRPPAGRGDRLRAVPSAVLDSAHEGDIEGALGRIRVGETGDERRGLRRRLLTFLAIVGPGLIVMVGDNDAGGVSTYAQAGQNYGYSLMWVLLLLVPVLIVNQEMVVRLGAVTGVGHARLINERFGRFWGWFSVGDLFLLNFLTITTEFIGVSLALAYFGISKYIAVPVAAVVLIAITTSGSFRRWEAAMLLFIASSAVLFPLAFLSHPAYGATVRHVLVPGIQGGVSSDAILLIIAIVGTTVAPWQLFFQQSNVVDKRITPRFIGYERADTFLGSIVVVVGAGALMIAGAYAVAGTSLAGHFTDALGVARALEAKDPVLGTLFAIVLLDASVIGAAAVTLSTSYAFGDFFGLKHSLHRSFRDAKAFYTFFTVLVVVAAGQRHPDRAVAVHRARRRAGRGRDRAAPQPGPARHRGGRAAARRTRQLADAAAGHAQAGHLAARDQTRHARPARVPGHRGAAPAGQGHPARHRLNSRRRRANPQGRDVPIGNTGEDHGDFREHPPPSTSKP
jgi:Mn2+/Fe2+ NRAMP family transporter